METVQFSVPSYLIAAQAHDAARGRLEDDQPGFIESSVELVSKGVPAALIAAGNEIANIPGTIGNWFTGPDNQFKPTSNRDAISYFDDDLAKYYDDHAMGIDTAGFVAASFIPGGIGVKAVRMAPTVLKTAFGAGKLGSTTADALGLFTTKRAQYLEEAVSQVTKGNVYSLTETNLLRALASGVGQNILEGAAATAVVNATMYQSPILNDRDASDLMWDVVTGGVIGGAVGGLFSGLQAKGAVKLAAGKAQEKIHDWTIAGLGGEVSPALSTSEKLITKLKQLESIPEINPTFEYAEYAGKVASQTKKQLELDVRKLFGELADGDQEIASLLNQTALKTGATKNAANLFNSEHITRIGKLTAAEKNMNKATSKLDDPLSATPEQLAAASSHRVTYLNVVTGEVLTDIPKVLTLADYGTPTIVRGGVKAGSRHIDTKRAFDPLKMDALTAEAFYFKAENNSKFSVLKGDKLHKVDANDIPTMQKAVRENVDVEIAGRRLGGFELFDYTRQRQAELAALLIKGGKSTQEAARIVNASEEVLTGGLDSPAAWNARDLVRKSADGFDPTVMPSTLKIITKAAGLYDDAGHLVDGYTAIAQKEKIWKQARLETVASGLGVNLPDSAGIVRRKSVGVVTGPSLLAAEGSGYGTVASFFSFVGQQTRALKQAAVEEVNEIFGSTLTKVANDLDSAIEWSVLNEKMRSLPQGYKYVRDEGALMHRRLAEAIENGDENLDDIIEELTEAGIQPQVPINSPLVQELVEDHITQNDVTRGILSKVHTNNGMMDRFSAGEFYPIPRNPKDTPFFAFVTDKSINGRGHSQMIYAKDGATLQKMIDDIRSDPELNKLNLEVHTKADAEKYYDAVGKFEFERTLSENYIQNALARKGKSASYLPLTDPEKIVNQFMDWHKQRATMRVRSLVEHQYADDFATLRSMSSPALEAAKSKFGYSGVQGLAEVSANDPAMNIIKMALDISKIDEYPIWSPLNKFLDGAASKLFTEVGRFFSAATKPEHLDDINTALKSAGYKGEEVTASLYEAMNGTVPRGTLTTIVARANALLASITLRADPINALNNALGHSVLLGPELKYVTDALKKGDAGALQELAALSKIKLLGTEDFIFSPQKLVARQISKFHTDTAGREWMKQNGFSTRIHQQYQDVLDDVALAISKGDETFLQSAMTKAKELGDTAEVWTGNKLAEEFNRYVAAGAMKDITDIAVKYGVMSADESLSYINTFVNRTQGNYLASQRPVIFQGPIGQAMGLFQTYQFNLIQQAFRHVSEGTAKNAAVMMGMQASIYGLNGLPAFRALNTHIIGEAGGNLEHKDLYDAIRSGAGKEAGDWITYGLGSNIFSMFHPDLKINLYTRGDLNPRHITLLPMDPTKVPIAQMSASFYKNIKDSYSQMKAGADVWPTVLSGIEHNGISRPLAGMAAVLGGVFSEDGLVKTTNTHGNLLAVHDWKTMTSFMRIAGAKPLDEAIMNDTVANIHAYRANDLAKREQLGIAIKTSIKDGRLPEQDQINKFADSYVRGGGKREGFNQFWTSQYKNIQASQSEQLRMKLSDPYHMKIQQIIGD